MKDNLLAVESVYRKLFYKHKVWNSSYLIYWKVNAKKESITYQKQNWTSIVKKIQKACEKFEAIRFLIN